jgi:alkyl hydroperoxide reductase subunit AhpF
MFIEMAFAPMSQMVADLVKLDERGRSIVDCANRTNVLDIFATTNVTETFSEQVLGAVGEGAKGALSDYEYLLLTL